jgi:hypothetical protein
MRKRETAVIAVMAVALLTVLALASSAAAEGFADIFLGASMTTKSDVDVDLDGVSADGEQDYKTQSSSADVWVIGGAYSASIRRGVVPA